MRAAAHHMVRFMTAGMALITCREPLLISINNNLRSNFLAALRVRTVYLVCCTLLLRLWAILFFSNVRHHTKQNKVMKFQLKWRHSHRLNVENCVEGCDHMYVVTLFTLTVIRKRFWFFRRCKEDGVYSLLIGYFYALFCFRVQTNSRKTWLNKLHRLSVRITQSWHVHSFRKQPWKRLYQRWTNDSQQ